MWHGTFTDLIQNINELGNELQKSVLVAETAYPFTLQWNDNTNNIVGLETQLLENYEATESGQFLFLHDLITLVSENNFGLGICYWSPDWISTEQFGSPWENQALFDFDGELLDAIAAFESSSVKIESVDYGIYSNIYNYPNPFNLNTTINYELPKDEFVTINVYDMLGNSICRLLHKSQSLGRQSLQWDATNNKGQLYEEYICILLKQVISEKLKR